MSRSSPGDYNLNVELYPDRYSAYPERSSIQGKSDWYSKVWATIFESVDCRPQEPEGTTGPTQSSQPASSSAGESTSGHPSFEVTAGTAHFHYLKACVMPVAIYTGNSVESGVWSFKIGRGTEIWNEEGYETVRDKVKHKIDTALKPFVSELSKIPLPIDPEDSIEHVSSLLQETLESAAREMANILAEREVSTEVRSFLGDDDQEPSTKKADWITPDF